MEAYLNDHLKMDSDGRVLFYPVDFTSPGYLVPDEALKKRIIRMCRLHQLLRYLVAVPIGIAVIYAIMWYPDKTRRSLKTIALAAGAAGYFLLYAPLEVLWRWYAARLAAGLEKVHE